ncbi:FAD-dependent monooxygenase [Nocardia gipuzkoensis]|uniref:FAD-dependent monooxygenase n=1 Tax=Nocardia gipuzkoensis TaxID=2749991 RepID=UPI001E442B46|nr:FAD-dependent monooxygenase [Nocardia gipuzkoensis]UGT72064.1 FAD-dependent monooxygenase [Nocardia gipuzkoensis]
MAGGLSRAGWRITLLEQAPQFFVVGAGITLEPNAVKALASLGLEDRLRSLADAHGSVGIRTHTGRWLVRSRASELRDRYGVPAYALHRSALHAILLDAVHDTDLHTGHRLTDLHMHSSGAVATAATNTGVTEFRADLIVGADGINSVTRGMLFSEHPGATYAGYVTWRGVVDSDAVDGINAPHAVTESWGRGQRFGIVPLTDGRIYWFATASLQAGKAPSAQGDFDALKRLFAGWHDPVERLLDATDPDTALTHDIYYLADELPSYVRGRAVLIGDAAHAITPDLGQGAALALEDATTLTAALAEVPDELEPALAHYDFARRRRTQKMVRTSAQVGKIGQWAHPIAAGLRNAVVGLIPTPLILRATAGALAWMPPTPPEHRNING